METVLGVSSSFGDSLDDAVLKRAPVHDQAGLGEAGPTNEDGAIFLHGFETDRLYRWTL